MTFYKIVLVAFCLAAGTRSSTLINLNTSYPDSIVGCLNGGRCAAYTFQTYPDHFLVLNISKIPQKSNKVLTLDHGVVSFDENENPSTICYTYLQNGKDCEQLHRFSKCGKENFERNVDLEFRDPRNKDKEELTQAYEIKFKYEECTKIGDVPTTPSTTQKSSGASKTATAAAVTTTTTIPTTTTTTTILETIEQNPTRVPILPTTVRQKTFTTNEASTSSSNVTVYVLSALLILTVISAVVAVVYFRKKRRSGTAKVNLPSEEQAHPIYYEINTNSQAEIIAEGTDPNQEEGEVQYNLLYGTNQ